MFAYFKGTSEYMKEIYLVCQVNQKHWSGFFFLSAPSFLVLRMKGKESPKEREVQVLDKKSGGFNWDFASSGFGLCASAIS